ncbi:Retrovirus-related Pol polyprotein from transposon TNT 1-94 [Vitis vinifera]|uniref:Retrovirus-related Pol polyprotein from transposon TNT 1-94 n=1 Tax=Vitis vinifera TaxID=29760 RepID=A0A438I1C2_VITVI|nr:Retrovirus-related Pol polyprotein from transposon TNT 1-94 [Vitis vinifera]
MIETRYNAKVRVLRSDNGGEYQSSDLQKYLEEHDIIYQTICSNTPQQNGVAKWKNWHLLEVVRASLIAAKILISYWGEAITSAAYLINRGEYHKEIQTLNYDYHISEEDESGQSELEALVDPRWKPAMNEEMESLQKNETWELVECPPGKKPVGCRWIYTVKYKADGSIERFKARLVAKGYTQTYGIDYTETFAPVAKINTIRVLLSLAANLDWPLQQFDVKNVFLHGELSEEVYMDLPPGCMVLEKQCHKVCKLKKSLYGLKQSPRAWFGRFIKSMRAFGYCQSNSDHTLFLKKQHAIEESLKLCVELNQVSTDKGRYQRLVGRLMYLAHTKPDLAYTLSVVSQYMHNPGEQHMNAVMRILRYLKNAPGKGILFAKNVDHQSIEVYTDVDWAGAVDDRRSTSGYFTFVGGNLITWKSKNQNVVARLSAEAEFRGMALGLCEALWLRLLLQDLGYLSRQPIRLFCDNKAACDIAHNPVQHDRTNISRWIDSSLRKSWMIRLWNCLRFDQKIN